MACNRMFIVCRKCDDVFCIGKTNYSGYFGCEYQEFGEQLREFYDKHDACGDEFDLVYESSSTEGKEITAEQWGKMKNNGEKE